MNTPREAGAWRGGTPKITQSGFRFNALCRQASTVISPEPTFGWWCPVLLATDYLQTSMRLWGTSPIDSLGQPVTNATVRHSACWSSNRFRAYARFWHTQSHIWTHSVYHLLRHVRSSRWRQRICVTCEPSGWYLLSLPVREMRATANAGGLVRRVILTSDKEDTFYLAQMAVGNERERMTVSIRRPADPLGTPRTEITVKPGSLTLVADVEAGTANPIIEWNFDADNVGNLPPPTLGQPGMPPGDPNMMGGGGVVPGTGFVFPGAGGGMDPTMGGMPAPAGPRIDARGLTAKIDYPNEEQNYRVEVTVRDRSGQKSPVKASLIVQVRA